ncbi:NitT/TauT family transport system substrate-binding protein [Rhizobium sp. BK226]|uniref:ABC transporter substrate-binding protein n=1 Tax=Rhizobium sp. BK226 TaxID=2587075 RepID=UPI00160F7BCD|nr:ABC transporter substrate-binding protein [Rhizobium sp. BK226]MBB4112828.1 NitT/TauT family transport system substrate-binding protein [Rhizobium sp. BK226]
MKHILPAVLLTLAAVLPAHAEDPRPLRIGWVQAMANAPALIAEEKGYFRDEGLKVELKGFGDGPIIQQAVAGGEIDVAYIGAPPVYQWAARGLDAKIIAKVSYGQAAVIAKADGPIHALSDLKGKRLAGVNRGSGMDVLLRGYVLKEAAGLSPDTDLSLSQMPVGNMNAALDTGVVDAAFLWEPFISQSVLRGAGRVVFDVNGALPGYPWYVVAAPDKTLKERPDDLVKLLRANSRAIAFLQEHPEEADRIIARSFKLEALRAADGSVVPPEAIVAEARKRLGWSAEIEPSDRAFIQRLIDYSVALGFLDKRLKVDDIIDDSFAAKAAAQR